MNPAPFGPPVIDRDRVRGPPRARLVYFGSLLAIMAIVQLRAQCQQVMSGFCPFSHPPTRVPYSWDMFAIRLDRCVVAWDPPLDIEGQRVGRWQDREPPFEFDTVFNDIAWYRSAVLRACTYRRGKPTIARLTCFRSDGEAHEFGFDCP